MSKQLKHLNKFIDFAKKELKLPSLPNIHFAGSEENEKQAFGHSTGNDITIRINDRHPIDIMRTIAHELIHVKQTQMGKHGEQFKEDEANAIAGTLIALASLAVLITLFQKDIVAATLENRT